MEIDDVNTRKKQKILDLLAKESPMVLSTAYIYATSFVKYGADVTKAWDTAVEQTAILERVRQQAQYEAYDSLKKDYDAELKSDMVAVLDEMRSEIVNHCSLIKENNCKCCCCNRVIGVGEVLKILDKYKAFYCNPLLQANEEE